MARPLRINLAGAWYHVTARGNERREIFRQEEDRQQFLDLMAEMVVRFGLSLHGYVLMHNHYHLVIETTQENLSGALQWLNVSYSQWFNRHYQRSGHLFQGRFQSILVDWQQWGLELSRYVHLNPIRIGRHRLDKRARQRNRSGVGSAVPSQEVQARLEALRSFPWSSYRAYIGLARKPEWLSCDAVLALLGGQKAERQRAYRHYVERAVLEGQSGSLWQHLKGQVVLGDESFVEQLQAALQGDEQEQAALKLLRRRPAWEEAVAVVEQLKGEAWEQFRDRRGDWGRDVALWLGRKQCGLKLKALAEAVGGLRYGSVGTAIKYLERRSVKDKELAKIMAEAKAQLMNNDSAAKPLC